MKYGDLKNATEEFTSLSAWGKVITPKGEFIKERSRETGDFLCNFPDQCELFEILSHGQKYHPSCTETFRKDRRVPIVIRESSLRGMTLSIHIDMARMIFWNDFEEVVKKLQCFCTQETTVPIVIRDGFQTITIPKIAHDLRVSIPIYRTRLSKNGEKSKKVRKSAKDFIGKIFKNTSDDMIEMLDRRKALDSDDCLLATTRYVQAYRSDKTELLLPQNVSADMFFKRLHEEENGFQSEGDAPLWLTESRGWGFERLVYVFRRFDPRDRHRSILRFLRG